MNERYRIGRALLAPFALLLLTLTAAACGSSGTTASQSRQDVPVPGSTPELTANEILELVRSATKSLVTVRAVGEFLAYEGDGIEEPEFATVVEEWTAPNRSHQTVRQDQGDGVVEGQTIVIGNRGFILGGVFGGSPEWREVAISRSFESLESGTPEPVTNEEREFGSNLDLILDEVVEVVELNGFVAYKISGKENIAENDPRVSNRQEASGEVVLFVDPESFLPLREERKQTIKAERKVQDPDAPGGSREETEESIFEMWFEFTYSDEPLVIEPPETFIPNGGSDAPPHTPTPVVPTPTPTVVTGINGTR